MSYVDGITRPQWLKIYWCYSCLLLFTQHFWFVSFPVCSLCIRRYLSYKTQCPTCSSVSDLIICEVTSWSSLLQQCKQSHVPLHVKKTKMNNLMWLFEFECTERPKAHWHSWAIPMSPYQNGPYFALSHQCLETPTWLIIFVSQIIITISVISFFHHDDW